MGKRVVITGGSGKAGKHVIDILLEKGYQVLNLDLQPLSGPASCRVHTLKVDLEDTGQVYSSLMSHFALTEPFQESIKTKPDAIIHFAGIARNMLVPDNKTFSVNTLAAYNIIEAACRLGIPKVILASSICVYGVTYAEGDVDFHSFPVDEDVDTNPMDVYGLSKLCSERTARSFATRFRTDIYALRIGPIIHPEEYNLIFASYVGKPTSWKVHGWSYTDVRDLAQMCLLCVERDGLGFQVFNATNDEITNDNDTTDFLRQQCPKVPFTRNLGPRESPISNKKIRRVLGFQEQHNWRQYFQG